MWWNILGNRYIYFTRTKNFQGEKYKLCSNPKVDVGRAWILTPRVSKTVWAPFISQLLHANVLLLCTSANPKGSRADPNRSGHESSSTCLWERAPVFGGSSCSDTNLSQTLPGTHAQQKPFPLGMSTFFQQSENFQHTVCLWSTSLWSVIKHESCLL